MSHFVCPHCGADVPPKRRSCPSCGASESDGWGNQWANTSASWNDSSDDDPSDYDADTDYDDSDFDYEEYVEREFGASRQPFTVLSKRQLRKRQVSFVIWAIIVVLLLTAFLPALL